MKTPKDWIELFANGTPKDLRAMLEHDARAYLSTLPPGITITTNKLGDVIFPRSEGEKSLAADVAMTEVYKMLQALARNEMSDCCMKGEVNGQYMGKPKRPWLWFCPEEVDCCRTCGRPWPVALTNEQ